MDLIKRARFVCLSFTIFDIDIRCPAGGAYNYFFHGAFVIRVNYPLACFVSAELILNSVCVRVCVWVLLIAGKIDRGYN